MLSLLTLFNSILLLVLTPILLFVIFFVIVPLLRMRSYQQSGIKKCYYPILGTFGRWFNNVSKYGDIMADSKRLTDYYATMPKVMVSNVNTRLFFVLNDPQYTKEFLQNSHLYYKSPIIDWARTFVKNGLITAEGEVWKRHRRIVSNAFHFEFLKSNISVIQDTAREFLDRIPKNGCDSYSVINKMQEITGEVVGRIFFGEDLNSYTFEGDPLTTAFAKIATELAACGWHPLVVLFGIRVIYVPFIPKFRKLVTRMRKFMQLCDDIIEERRSKPQQSKDLLASLLATQNSEDGDKRLSNVEIIDEFITFFLAGMDTTGKTIGMTLYMLTQYPQYLKELKEERETIYNKTDRVTSGDVQKMEILHSFIKETFRFYTPAPTPFIRVAATDHMLFDLPIKKGDFIVCDYLAPAHDTKNFENPQKFSPERWRSPEISKLDPYAFIPFSAGPRNCIGQHLALIESKIILSEFLNRFDFKLKDDYKLKMVFKLTYETEEPFYFELSPIKP